MHLKKIVEYPQKVLYHKEKKGTYLMKKILIIFVCSLLLLTGCAKDELAQLNGQIDELNDTIADRDDEIADLEGQIQELNVKVDDAEGFVQSLSDENTQLKKDKDELQASLDELQLSSSDRYLGTWAGDTYSNDYLGLSLVVPDGWYKASEEEMSQVFGNTFEKMEAMGNFDFSMLDEGDLLPLFYVVDTANQNQSTYLIMTVVKSSVRADLPQIAGTAVEQILPLLQQQGECEIVETSEVDLAGQDAVMVKLSCDLNDYDFVLFYEYYYFYVDAGLATVEVGYEASDEAYVKSVLSTLTFQ